MALDLMRECDCDMTGLAVTASALFALMKRRFMRTISGAVAALVLEGQTQKV
jgi:hypothetical protein